MNDRRSALAVGHALDEQDVRLAARGEPANDAIPARQLGRQIDADVRTGVAILAAGLGRAAGLAAPSRRVSAAERSALVSSGFSVIEAGRPYNEKDRVTRSSSALSLGDFMSGPKCYSYHVAEDPAVVAARREAQALAREQARIAGALGRLAALRDEAAGLRERHGGRIGAIAVPAAPAAATSAEAATVAARLEAAAQQAEQTLRTEAGAARSAAFLAGSRPGRRRRRQTGSGASTGSSRPPRPPARRRRGPPQTAARPCGPRTARLVRVFGRLRADAGEEARAQVEGTFDAALAAAGTDRAPLLADRLRAAVQAANAETGEREARAAEVDALLAGLGEVAAADAEPLRHVLLAERTKGRALPALAALVETARAEARKRDADERKAADRAQVAAALGEAFAELGYDVQDDFEVAVGDGGALVRREGWSEHAVRARLDPRTSQLRLHVVRDPRGQVAGDDVRYEEELCGDREAIEAAVAARGVGLDPVELTPPGVVPVARVPLEGVVFSPSRAAARRRPQERSL